MAKDTKDVVGWLITIGDEILLGDILNGNARYIASALRAKGFRLGREITVGDRESEIIQVLLESQGKSQFLMVTGGLGSTEDDRTCEAVSKAFGLPLVPNPEYTAWIEDRLNKRGRPWTEGLRKMVKLPKGARKLGMEMAGFFLEYRNVPCYFLPGVPSETKALMREMVIPELEERFPGRLHYAKHLLRVQGLFESDVSERLRGLSFEEWEVELGYLPQGPEIWLTFFASGKDGGDVMARIGSAQEAVISTLGDLHVSGRDEECLEVVVGRKLRERVWKIAAAESCTGGLLSKRITSVAGASDYFECGYVTYSNRAKMELLGVSEEILKAHGAVSEPVALAMAEGARTRAGVDVALALTGVAGPSGGTHEKPVGTVFIACATASGSTVQKYLFGGDRGRIQEAATHAALVLLWRSLLT